MNGLTLLGAVCLWLYVVWAMTRDGDPPAYP